MSLIITDFLFISVCMYEWLQKTDSIHRRMVHMENTEENKLFSVDYTLERPS